MGANLINGIKVQDSATITPSDSTTFFYDGFWLENNATVHFQYAKDNKTAGSEQTLNLQAGYHPRQIYKVFATGSSITGVIEGLKGI